MQTWTRCQATTPAQTTSPTSTASRCVSLQLINFFNSSSTVLPLDVEVRTASTCSGCRWYPDWRQSHRKYLRGVCLIILRAHGSGQRYCWRCKLRAPSKSTSSREECRHKPWLWGPLPQVPLGYQGPLLARPVNASCVQIPNELPGVFSVAALGVQRLRSYYSNFSKRFIQVLALL